jgi:hypothetical protein
MLTSKAMNRLEDGAESDTGETGTDKVGAGGGRRVLAAGDVLLAALVEGILDGDSDEDGDCLYVSICK